MSGALLEIRGESGAELVRVSSDGEIEFGESYTPDAAARMFWNALARHVPMTFSCAELQMIQDWANIRYGEFGPFDEPDEQALADRIDAGLAKCPNASDA